MSWSLETGRLWWENAGSRKTFVLTVFSGKGTYPDIAIDLPEAVYSATPGLVYTCVESSPIDDDQFSEISWVGPNHLRFWGALAFSIEEGQGFYAFYPLKMRLLYAKSLDAASIRRAAARLAATEPSQRHELHWVRSPIEDVIRLYEALTEADPVLLRGVNCYLKSLMLWQHEFFREEMGINLHISLEAGLGTLRRRMIAVVGRDVPFHEVFDFIRANFSHGDALADFWQDSRDDRLLLLHPESRVGAYAIPPLFADDIYELLDPMLSLYRFLLLGTPRPQFDGMGHRIDARGDTND